MTHQSKNTDPAPETSAEGFSLYQEHARAQQALKESQQRFEAFMQNSPAVAWMKDELGRYIYANAALKRVYRISTAEILGKTDYHFLPEKTARKLRERDQIVRASGKALRAMEIIPDPAGREHSWIVVKFPYEGPQGEHYVGGLAFDITDQIEIQQRLNESEERFSSIFENAPLGISIAVDGHYLYVNSLFLEMFGHASLDEVKGLPITHHIAPAQREELARMVTQGEGESDEAMPLTYNSMGLRRDGTTFPFNLQLSRLQLREGMASVGFITDISRRLELEQQLLQSQKMDSIGQLAGGIAHDFNNLLTIIRGHATLLQQRVDLPPEALESLDQIVASVERGSSLTHQLLSFSRHQVMTRQVLDLNEVIVTLLKMVARVLHENITLSLDLEPNLPCIKADRGMLEQVLLNLVVNARDAMASGGTLTLQSRRITIHPTNRLLHPNRRLGDFIALSVQDTGCGIPPEHLPKVFDPFFTTKEEGKGTGLGLATAYGILQQHEGWIELKTELGRGTTLALFLPNTLVINSESDLLGSPPVALSPEPRAAQQPILLVEDEPSVRTLARKILERAGCTVLEAASPAEALRMAERTREVGVLITDIVLSEGVSGLELAARIQALHPALPVVFTSGHPPEHIPCGIPLVEGKNFLQKPYVPTQLMAVVGAILGWKVP